MTGHFSHPFAWISTRAVARILAPTICCTSVVSGWVHRNGFVCPKTIAARIALRTMPVSAGSLVWMDLPSATARKHSPPRCARPWHLRGARNLPLRRPARSQQVQYHYQPHPPRGLLHLLVLLHLWLRLKLRRQSRSLLSQNKIFLRTQRVQVTNLRHVHAIIHHLLPRSSLSQHCRSTTLCLLSPCAMA